MDDVMFDDEFYNVLMQNEPKGEMSLDIPRKSSANFVNLRKRSHGLRTTPGQCSEIFGLKIVQNVTSCSSRKKLLEGKKWLPERT